MNEISIPEKRNAYISTPPLLSDSILNLGKEIEVKKNTILIETDTVPQYCYVILSGSVMAYETYLNGDDRIYIINKEGALILESQTLYRVPMDVNFVVSSDSRLKQISRQELVSAIANDTDAAFSIIASLSQKFLSSMRSLRQNRSFNTAWKVCDIFLILANLYGEEYLGMTMIKDKVSQQLLSNILGVNRITVTHVIKDLKTQNLLVTINGYYCIPDIEKLKEYQEAVER